MGAAMLECVAIAAGRGSRRRGSRRRGSRRRGSHERGSATVLTLGIIAVALVLAVSLAGLARASASRWIAQGAADLAALAAARVAVDPAAGGHDPCELASDVATRHGARLDSCEVQAGAMVEVSVSVRVTPIPGWSTRAVAEARAGPVGRE